MVLPEQIPTENDASGDPSFKFPPFPSAPEGHTIIPFRDFIPSGIQQPALGFPDDIERDGLGIETCKLANDRSVEDNEMAATQKTRKNKKKRKYDGSKKIWYEDWAVNEETRFVEIDPGLPMIDRFHKASSEFVTGRRFINISEIQSIYDNWRLFVGLLGRQIQEPMSKTYKSILKDQENVGKDTYDDDFDEYDEDDIVMNPITTPATNASAQNDEKTEVQNPPPDEKPKDESGDKLPAAKSDDWDAADHDTYLRDCENEEEYMIQRMESFFEAPVYSTKVFLSSHYRDKGLIWTTNKLAHGPILLRFFFEFLLRNKVLPELTPKLSQALNIIAEAEVQLPATGIIGYAVPDNFSKICINTWGSQAAAIEMRHMTWSDTSSNSPPEISTPGAASGWNGSAEGLINVGKLERELEKSRDEGDGDDGGGWGQGSWNNFDNDAEAEDGEGKRPVVPEANWEDDRKDFSFMALLGPVAQCFAQTHEPKLAEDGLRYITAIHAPGSAFAGVEQAAGMGCIELAPWKKPENSQLANTRVAHLPYDKSNKPEVVDPLSVPDTQKKIMVLVHPNLVDKCIKGMVFGGLFVKLAPKEDLDPAEVDETPLRNWWYIEKLIQVLPSYYAEHRDDYISILVHSADETPDLA